LLRYEQRENKTDSEKNGEADRKTKRISLMHVYYPFLRKKVVPPILPVRKFGMKRYHHLLGSGAAARSTAARTVAARSIAARTVAARAAAFGTAPWASTDFALVAWSGSLSDGTSVLIGYLPRS
jgi:hypothetical protein